MRFNLETPGLIILNQFKNFSPKENINNYWYISTDGIDFFSNNVGVLSHVNFGTNYLLDLIVKYYKLQFEFSFEKVDLGFFQHWSCVQIQIHSSPSKSYYSNVALFLNNLNIDYYFDQNTFLYYFKDFPEVRTQLDVYEFINCHIYQNLSSLFQSKNIAHTILTEKDYLIFNNYTNKIDFLEKIRFKKQLENKFPLKNIITLKKI